MEFNFKIIALAALVPLVMGFLWYGPMLFKNAWMKEMGFTEESMKGANMALIFGLSYVFSFFIGFVLEQIVIHQFGIQSTLFGEPGFAEATGEAYTYFQDFMSTYGDRFRTFKHGALHGAMTGLFFAMPIMATNAMFERKSFKYVAINVGYWTITLALMGGILCQYN
ncbi:MAG: DUF1761 domain-containing protein [Flavobacteriaceae bacterium]|nr:DUF1761 domain-containing protein [Flavobacteriaceae bacterium]MBL4905641.1 DUF1761 domain-containing protein [Flavobacteriaceae bacterium]